MAKKFSRREPNIPLSQFGVLVAQLESIVASAAHKAPDPLLCFDLISDLISAINDEPKESIMLWQRKCEEALFSLLVLGARRPVRHLASVAMAKIIWKGDPISIYSRASSLQGFLSDGKRSDPQCVAGVAQCLGELYRLFGRKITSGFSETTSIASKLMKFHEEYVRKEALNMLRNALEGCGGAATTAALAYIEAFRLIMRFGVVDKSSIVRIAAARCLKTFANVGGPGLGAVELDNSASTCVKVFGDPNSSVRDAFAEALGAVLALGMNPEAQVQLKGKGQLTQVKKLEDSLQRHLVAPFVKASGIHARDVRLSLTLAWVSFMQVMLLKYLHPDNVLQDFTDQVMDMLRGDTSVDAQDLACVLYILRVGVVDQMTEPTQRSFLVILGKQLQSPDSSPAIKVASLRTLSYTLKTLGEVPMEFREVFDDTVVAALSHSSQMVRVEAALAVRAVAEVDPTCVSGLVSYAVTMLTALGESISFDKGNTVKADLDSLHGQASLLAALVSISPKLPLGYPARLPHSVLEVSQKMLNTSSRNSGAATHEKEAGWLLLASLLASIPKEELEDHAFDILALWAPLFSGNPEHEIRQTGDLASKICEWSAAIDALIAFVRCFLSPKAVNYGILLQPVLVYLSSALSLISFIATKELPGTKCALNVLIIRTLSTFQSLSDPMAYKSDHPKLLQLCTAPFRDPSAYEESSCLRLLLDKRDAWLGPWIPGRDWFEDELRAFQGGKNGLMPCIWDAELVSFPEPESVNTILVNQKLLCFGTMFAVQDSGGMQSLLGIIEQSLKSGKKQSWYATIVNNICVGLLAGLKALISFRPQLLGSEILNQLQSIFQGILAEGDMSASVRRASAEGLGLLSRLGSDTFTARMTKTLLSDLAGATDASYSGSIAVALGCIHRSAGGMALSSLVPATVGSISSLAKSPVAGLQIWSLHGLLLTIEAAGFSYVSHVQATLSLGLEILLSEENGWVDLQQGVARLINAIVAVLGPELAPGSIFFSHCKSVIAEISSGEETAALLENVRFTQQLVLFAPQALPVHSHVQTLLPTLSSRQPTLRHLAISTLRHLIEKDSASVILEQIEENLFHMLDEETDAEIGNLIRSTLMRLLYVSCPTNPSRWILICRKLVFATSSRDLVLNSSTEQDTASNLEGDTELGIGDDDENMVSSGNNMSNDSKNAFSLDTKREKLLRYKTRAFAAECLGHLPTAVGNHPAHFDLSLARNLRKGPADGDWLALRLQEIVSLAYQISTIKFESMQPIGVGLLSAIMDKFGEAPDPELPGRLLLEQYQAQLVSALRSSLNMSSSPTLLEAGLNLATKILTSGIIRGDQAAVKRIFSLISRPLDDFEDLYYPSFAEWVSCKIKIRLLAAHASLKCYTYTSLRDQQAEIPSEYIALLPLFSKSSSVLGKRWIGILNDYCYLCLNLHLKKDWKPFLDGIRSPVVASKLRTCFDESWHVILQAVALDAIPVDVDIKSLSQTEDTKLNFISGYRMVELGIDEFQFLWAFALLLLFQGPNATVDQCIIPLASTKSKCVEQHVETKPLAQKSCEILLPVFQSLCAELFFSKGYLTMEVCREFLQALSFAADVENSWNYLAITVLSEIVLNSPDDYLKNDNFASLVMELSLAYLYKIIAVNDTIPLDESSKEILMSKLFSIAKNLLNRFGNEKQLKLTLAFMLAGYKCARRVAAETSFSKIAEFIVQTCALLNNFIKEEYILGNGSVLLQSIIGACQSFTSDFTKDCIEGIHLLENKRSNLRRLLYAKLAFCLEQMLFYADLVCKIGLCPDKKISKNAAIFVGCTRSIQLVVTDSNVQVQAIGLQVIKNMVQKSSTMKASMFPLLLTVELLRDILIVIQNILMKPLTRESAALAGECLRTLALMQTLPKEVESQKSVMNLLLETVVMILSSTENNLSEGTSDIRSTAIKLVSNIAQVPSAAEHLKEVLLEMPVTHRQQIQNSILASVTQEHQTTQVKPNVGRLEIKLPHPSIENKPETSARSYSHQTDDDVDDGDEDEDDWDAFQSFPAATNGTLADSTSNAENPSVLEDDAFQEFSDSTHSLDVCEGLSKQHQYDEGDVMQPSPQNSIHEPECGDLALKQGESCESHYSSNTYGVASSQDDDLSLSDSQQPLNITHDDVFEDFPDSVPSEDLKETISEHHQNCEVEMPQLSPQKSDVKEGESSDLALKSHDPSHSSGPVSKQDDDLVSLCSQQEQPNETVENADERNAIENVMIKESSSDLAFQMPENLVEPEASHSEVDEVHMP